MADQLRHDWIGCNGGGHVDTPAIDTLAGRGVRYTQATCTAPICAPSRISLAAGLLPHRLGALDNHAWLPLSRPTLYQRMRDHGYRVAGIGKLDLAKPDGFNGRDGRRPITYSWGFTDPHEVEGKLHAGRGNPPNGPYTTWLAERGLLESFVDDYAKRAVLRDPAASARPSVLPPDAFADRYIGH
ncbi:MAG: sulfatase-like hydrolase/transferase, partial [Opitutales bacterium]|nr:sulfatase-like hydrolase/transferase [Opitutales bacterium]